MPATLTERIDAVEEAYEYMLAYAAQGRTAEGDHALSQIRAMLSRAAAALDGIDAAARTATAAHPARAECDVFIAMLAEDANRALASIRLALAARSISSQLVDNLNGGIHLRALLTDLFIIDEFLKDA